jgi:cell division transport system ATP-binding protein
MIEFRNVSKRNDNQQVLNNVDLTIETGEFVFLTGPSGTGKSTLFRLLIAQDKVDSGNIFIDGFDITKINSSRLPELRRQVFLIFQDFKLIPDKTVFENIAFPLEVSGMPQYKIEQLVNNVLGLVRLEYKANKYPSDISGGERQRVAIARAVVLNPKILLADEPTGNLDPETTYEIIHLLEEINKSGTTVIVATHNMDLLKTFKHKNYHLQNGSLISRDPKNFSDIFNDLRHMRISDFQEVSNEIIKENSRVEQPSKKFPDISRQDNHNKSLFEASTISNQSTGNIPNVTNHANTVQNNFSQDEIRDLKHAFVDDFIGNILKPIPMVRRYINKKVPVPISRLIEDDIPQADINSQQLEIKDEEISAIVESDSTTPLHYTWEENIQEKYIAPEPKNSKVVDNTVSEVDTSFEDQLVEPEQSAIELETTKLISDQFKKHKVLNNPDSNTVANASVSYTRFDNDPTTFTARKKRSVQVISDDGMKVIHGNDYTSKKGVVEREPIPEDSDILDIGLQDLVIKKLLVSNVYYKADIRKMTDAQLIRIVGLSSIIQVRKCCK